MIGTGIVTVLFTDLVEWSRLLERLGDDEADRVRRAHFRALRRIVGRHDGREVKSLGDGLMVVFPSAVAALSCAVEMQRSTLDKNEADPDRAVGIRVGIHAGEPIQDDDDFFGTAVVVAKRLCDSAHGGQIGVSDLVRNIVGSRRGFSFNDIGVIDLKGFDAPIRAWELDWQSAPETALRPADDEGRPAAGRRYLAVLALAAALALGGLVGALLYGGAEEPASDDGTAGPGRTRSPAGSGSSAAGAELRWARATVEGAAGERNYKMLRLIEAGGRLIAVGDAGEGAGVWISTDGITWDAVADPELDRPGENETIWGVTRFQGRLYAAGTTKTGAEMDAAIWTSRDGTSWRRVDDADLGGFGDQSMNRIIAFNRRLIAVGYEDLFGGQGWDGGVWISRDGDHWRQIPDTEDGDLGGAGNQDMRGMAKSPDRLIVVGRDAVPGDEDGAAWVSREGRLWGRLAEVNSNELGGPSNQVAASVAYDGSEFIAVGWHTPYGNPDAIAWRSEDGTFWTRFPSDESTLGGRGRQQMWGISATRDGWIASGVDRAGGLNAAVWRFAGDDGGETWTKVGGASGAFGGEGEQVMKWVVDSGSLLVGVGWQGPPASLDAAAWYARPRRSS